MTTLAPAAAFVKFDSARPIKSRRPFALGLARDNTAPRPLGYSAADRRWAAANLNSAPEASDEEWADEFERRTMSAAEWRSFRAELACATADRYTRAGEAEMAENGVIPSDAELDRMAEEAAWADAYDRGVVAC